MQDRHGKDLSHRASRKISISLFGRESSKIVFRTGRYATKTNVIRNQGYVPMCNILSPNWIVIA